MLEVDTPCFESLTLLSVITTTNLEFDFSIILESNLQYPQSDVENK